MPAVWFALGILFVGGRHPSNLLLITACPAEAGDFLPFAEIGILPLALASFGDNLLCFLGIPVIAESGQLTGGFGGGRFDLRKQFGLACVRFDEWGHQGGQS